jgi:hypothetical protein
MRNHLVGGPEKEILLGRPWRKYEDILKLVIMQSGGKPGLDSCGSRKGQRLGYFQHGDKSLVFI